MLEKSRWNEKVWAREHSDSLFHIHPYWILNWPQTYFFLGLGRPASCCHVSLCLSLCWVLLPPACTGTIAEASDVALSTKTDTKFSHATLCINWQFSWTSRLTLKHCTGRNSHADLPSRNLVTHPKTCKCPGPWTQLEFCTENYRTKELVS